MRPAPAALRQLAFQIWRRSIIPFGRYSLRTGAMDPWHQLCFMDLFWVGWFVVPYLQNPTSYGHETCTIGYS